MNNETEEMCSRKVEGDQKNAQIFIPDIREEKFGK